MARLFSIGLIVALIGSGWSRGADEEYDLRGPDPIKGQVYTMTAKSTGKNLNRTIKVKDNTITERFDEVTTKVKEIEVLAVANGEITKMRTKFIEDKREEIFRKGKREVKRNVDRDLHGQFVYSERLPTGWKNSLEDVAPNDKQKSALKDYVPFKEEDIFYPTNKVKIGHEWKIDPKLFDKVLGKQLEDFKGTGSGKFLRVEKGDGEDVAVLEMDFELTGKNKEEDLVMDVKISGKGLVFRSLKHGFDRKSTTTLTMSMKGGGESEGEKVEIDFNGTFNAEDLIDLKAKK